jgi:hypothetical protein
MTCRTHGAVGLQAEAKRAQHLCLHSERSKGRCQAPPLAARSTPSIWTENETYYEYGKWATPWFGPKHSVQTDDVRLFPAEPTTDGIEGREFCGGTTVAKAANEINQSNYRGRL